MTIEFTAWPKTPRLFRDAVITEKIDGTNAAVIVYEPDHGIEMDGRSYPCLQKTGEPIYAAVGVETSRGRRLVAAQSRSRIISPESDNFGFAAYVREHAAELAEVLRDGIHYGEWWGHGIQRGYGLDQGDRRFSLFNVHKYGRAIPTHDLDPRPRIPGLGVVPVLDTHTFDTSRVSAALDTLVEFGSQAAPGFMNPEGVIVFHSQAGQVFKALLDSDHLSKTEAEKLEVSP